METRDNRTDSISMAPFERNRCRLSVSAEAVAHLLELPRTTAQVEPRSVTSTKPEQDGYPGPSAYLSSDSVTSVNSFGNVYAGAGSYANSPFCACPGVYSSACPGVYSSLNSNREDVFLGQFQDSVSQPSACKELKSECWMRPDQSVLRSYFEASPGTSTRLGYGSPPAYPLLYNSNSRITDFPLCEPLSDSTHPLNACEANIPPSCQFSRDNVCGQSVFDHFISDEHLEDLMDSFTTSPDDSDTSSVVNSPPSPSTNHLRHPHQPLITLPMQTTAVTLHKQLFSQANGLPIQPDIAMETARYATPQGNVPLSMTPAQILRLATEGKDHPMSNGFVSPSTARTCLPSSRSSLRSDLASLPLFLKELLHFPCYEDVIHWVNKGEGLFKIADSQKLAELWGNFRRKGNMTFAKFSRALRYYYRKGIIEKCSRDGRLVYRMGPRSNWKEFLPRPGTKPGRFFKVTTASPELDRHDDTKNPVSVPSAYSSHSDSPESSRPSLNLSKDDSPGWSPFSQLSGASLEEESLTSSQPLV